MVLFSEADADGAMRGRGMPGFGDECHSLSIPIAPYIK